MIRLAVSVEGHTEEEFVKSVLVPHLRNSGIETTPVLVGSARGRSGGGNVSLELLAKEMVALYWKHDAVTSLVDFYGFRGKGVKTIDQLEQDLNQRIKEDMSAKWDQRRVIAYIQLHEFEGLLFSKPEAFGAVFGNAAKCIVTKLHQMRSRLPTPEDINDSPHSAPSKRISDAIPSYRKRLDGPSVADEIGLTVIRRECTRFNGWLTQLESLGTTLLQAGLQSP